MGRQPYWSFGDVIRVDPEKNPNVLQPDDRRWLVLSPPNMSAARPWLTLFLGPGGSVDGSIVPFGSMTGFVRVEEAEA